MIFSVGGQECFFFVISETTRGALMVRFFFGEAHMLTLLHGAVRFVRGGVGSRRPPPHCRPPPPPASSSFPAFIPHSSHTHSWPLGPSPHLIHSCTHIKYQRAVVFIHFSPVATSSHHSRSSLVSCASSSATLAYTCVFPPAPPSALGGTGGPGTWCWPPRRPPPRQPR